MNKQFSQEVYNFLELMGMKLAYMELAEILFYFETYAEANKLPREEREAAFNRIKNLEIMEG